MAEFNEDVQKQGTDVNTQEQQGNGTGAQSEDKKDVQAVNVTSVKTAEERTVIKDINDDVREITFTEKDGTVLSAQMQAPSIQQAESIDDERSVFIPNGDGSTIMKLTNVSFHTALFDMFTKNSVTVNGQAAGKPISWDFFNEHSREAYKVFMQQADTFLTDFA